MEWGQTKGADSPRCQHGASWLSAQIHSGSHSYPEAANKGQLALPSSQCAPTALYRRPLAASALPPCLAAPQPGKNNKGESVEEEIKGEEHEGMESTWDADWNSKDPHCSGLKYRIPANAASNFLCSGSLGTKPTGLKHLLVTYSNAIPWFHFSFLRESL